MYIHEILPLTDSQISYATLQQDRQGGVFYEVCAVSDVIVKEIPELILVNCQIKEVNQKDEEIV